MIRRVGSPRKGATTSTEGCLSCPPLPSLSIECNARGVKINRSQQNDKLLAVVAVAERKEGRRVEIALETDFPALFAAGVSFSVAGREGRGEERETVPIPLTLASSLVE